MKLPPLRKAILIKRYKRFLADIQLDDGNIITIHCANTGAMTGCANPGDFVWYSSTDNPNRKYPYSWELTETQDGHLICVNTAKANRIVQEAIENKVVPKLNHYSLIQPEVKYGRENSRIDLLLSNHDESCYVEIKSVTLYDEKSGNGYFPDTVTTRGQKHLRELMSIVEEGRKAAIFFLIQHTGIRQFSSANFIDEKYSQLLIEAQKKGVQILCYNTQITTKEILVNHKISFVID